jgi:hypothetical protein
VLEPLIDIDLDEVNADPRPPTRVRDPELLTQLHREWDECVLCRSTGRDLYELGQPWIGLSLHHVSNHPRDDLRENLVMLCGHGTAGCHGRITVNEIDTCNNLAHYIADQRPDIMIYLTSRFGDAWVWLERHLYG